MDNGIFLFGAYTIIWAGVLGYLIKQFGQQKRLAKEVEILKRDLRKKDKE
jgi:CcmD family protein